MINIKEILLWRVSQEQLYLAFGYLSAINSEQLSITVVEVNIKILYLFLFSILNQQI
ncbi:hypothetical protein H1P_1710014 [Hyella patelloides LEGE 07179]|uniref:Uncharacterized protein n=1 Tax=Hyella patelloides LEGE 07179 TaxID=945734 RepID=A0A563VND2_9CYAN|nr:hypothetical protein H1P_1710014 [Hyella patelloides LEGE 07179]